MENTQIIYNEDRTEILHLDNIDLTKGYLYEDVNVDPETGDRTYTVIYHEYTERDRLLMQIADFNSKISDAQVKLQETDYMVIKIEEAQILGDNELANELKTTYHKQLLERVKIRNDINTYMNKITELNALVAEIDKQ